MDNRIIDVKRFFDAQSLLDQLSLIERQLLVIQYSHHAQIDDPKTFSEIYEVTYAFLEGILENKEDGKLILDINKFRALINYYNKILSILKSDSIKSETSDLQDRIEYIVENIRIVKDNFFAIFHLTEEDLIKDEEA